MSQRGRQRPTNGQKKIDGRLGQQTKSTAPGDGVLSLAFLPGNFKKDLVELWNFTVSRPREAIVAFLTFLGAIKAALELFEGSPSRENFVSRSSDGFFNNLSVSKPGALLLFIFATVSIAWTLMTLTRLLSRSQNEAWRMLSYGLSVLFGLFLMFTGQQLLSGGGQPRQAMFADNIAFFILAVGGAGSILLLKTGFRLTNEFDPQVVERRSMIMLFFLISYIVSIALVTVGA
ncbi:MAG: hypothetical protein HWE23_03070 [Rhodobacteraceae bacterium]|nr:hypothetical protein [Paracoccaceae bacterium]